MGHEQLVEYEQLSYHFDPGLCRFSGNKKIRLVAKQATPKRLAPSPRGPNTNTKCHLHPHHLGPRRRRHRLKTTSDAACLEPPPAPSPPSYSPNFISYADTHETNTFKSLRLSNERIEKLQSIVSDKPETPTSALQFWWIDRTLACEGAPQANAFASRYHYRLLSQRTYLRAT